MIRPARAEDLAAIVDVCAQSLIHDVPDASRFPELLGESPYSGPSLRLVAEDDHGVVGVSLAALRNEGEGPAVGYVDLLAVAPRVQRKGAGRSLLAASEEVLTQAGAVEVRLGGNAPCYVWPGIDPAYSPAVELATSAGYQECGDAFNMAVNLTPATVDTTPDEERLREAGISVRALQLSDQPSFSSWVAEHWNRDWAWEASRALRINGAACYVATREAGFVGFAAGGCARPGWFGPMGTVPAEQKRGIGSVLLRRCLTDDLSAGRTSSTIAWVGPADFYKRTVGATVDRVFKMYRKSL
ncbi:MAG TPA: GNAT family N-acetyltransferase [Acidimicrobiales bacterium]|nr:GNAT family N-acetyltransferase [Acidimicrobiales bacterium]